MTSNVLSCFGGEGYADSDDMKEKIDWTYTRSLQFPKIDVFGTQDETWIQPSSSTGFAKSFYFDPSLNGVVEIELSTAIYMSDVTRPSTSTKNFVRIGNGIVALATVLGSTNTFIYMGGTSSFNLSTVVVNKPIKLFTGQLFYITLRVRAETTDAANDGIVEVYANDELIYKLIDVNTGTLTSSQYITFNAIDNYMKPYYRNVSIRDGWSTAEGIAPSPVYIQNLSISNVTSSYTIEGGASTQLDALTDGDDTTYITTDVVSESATIGFTPDPSLATFPVQHITGTIGVSRGSTAPNIITYDIQDDGVSILGESEFSVSTVGTNVEKFEIGGNITPTVLTDLEFVISNGS